jgi:hypothetical protein
MPAKPSKASHPTRCRVSTAGTFAHPQPERKPTGWLTSTKGRGKPAPLDGRGEDAYRYPRFGHLERLVHLAGVSMGPALLLQLLVPLGQLAPCLGVDLPLLVRLQIRVRVEIMGSQTYENVGESQSVLIMNDPIISTRTRIARPTRRLSPAQACPGVPKPRSSTRAERKKRLLRGPVAPPRRL